MQYSDKLEIPGSPYVRSKKLYLNSKEGKKKLYNCSTCATLYRDLKFSYQNVPPKVVDHTETGIYIVFDKKTTSGERCDNMLLYGSALNHTTRKKTPDEHLQVQKSLLKEAYDNFLLKKTYCPTEKTSIMYIKMTNFLERSKTVNIMRVTHPHVWIVNTLADYNGKIETYPFDTSLDVPLENTPDVFIDNLVEIADKVCLNNPKNKVYLKFYINNDNLKIIRGEVDIC